MKTPIERLSSDARRLLFALLAIERDADRQAGRALVLYEEVARDGSSASQADALRIVGAALGTSPEATHFALAKLARDHHGALLTNPRHVLLAALGNLDRWPHLDDTGRHAAIEEECWNELGRDLVTVATAVSAHGLPVAAPDLHPPLTGGFGHTDRCLQMWADIGELSRTDARNPDGWPIYDVPTRTEPLAEESAKGQP